jgi:hypothetical protein
MTQASVRILGASNATQQLIWDKGDNTSVKVHCWGAGGGGGGNDSYSGGSGSGGGYAYTEFAINNGDILSVAVGSPGGPGATSAANSGGGAPGSGYLTGSLFDTATSIPSGWDRPFYTASSSLVKTFGIWPNNYSISAAYEWSITVPTTGDYTFQTGFYTTGINKLLWFVSQQTPNCIVTVDGVDRFFVVASELPYEQLITLEAGVHTIGFRTNSDNSFWQQGPGSFAMRIGSTVNSFSGSRGGNAGDSGVSGAGGGGGGATVVFLNNTMVAVAGGGGGGGGGGAAGGGFSAPGIFGQASAGINNGQNGVNKFGDGGGGGGGGGGLGGGQGGTCPGGDVGGRAGSNGGNFGLQTAFATGIVSAGASDPFYNASVGRGGGARLAGTNGACVIEFFVYGINVNTALGWQSVTNTYVKTNNVWSPVQAAWVKHNDQWQPVLGFFSPEFIAQTNTYGVDSRIADRDAEPDPGPGPDPGGAYDAGGGGGACFLAGTMITLWDRSLKAIENIVPGDMILEALTNKPVQVLGIKTRGHNVDKWIFALDQTTEPFITEEHPFYNDKNELCAISDLAQKLAPWLGTIKIVEVANKKKINESVPVYNIMLETGTSYYANGVPVNNIVQTGGTYALVHKGYLDKMHYEQYVYNHENQNISAEQQALIFNYTLKLTNYVLQHNNYRSKILGRLLSWAVRNRTTLYPWLEAWFRSPVRRWIFGKNI